MKINLLDPGHISAGGHNYDWNQRIANELARRGHEVRLYIGAQATPEMKKGYAPGISVTPLFQTNPYVPASAYDPVSGEVERQIGGTRQIASELQSVAPADLWLWPTAFAYQLRACSIVPVEAEISACVHIPPSNELRIPYSEPGEWWRFAARSLIASGRRIRAIGPAEPDGLNLFQPYIGMLNLKPLPIPFDGTPRARNTLKTIGFFGNRLRSEQGLGLKPQLVSDCLQAGFKIITQMENSLSPEIAAHPNLTLLDGEGSFAEKLEACDLVVAAYRWDTYVGRNSGVVSQALASGVPCVAPDGASFSRMLGQGAVFFSELRAPAILEAIQKAQASYPALASAAFDNAQAWRKSHGIAHFVDAMIS